MQIFVEEHILEVNRHRIEDDDGIVGRHRDHVDHGVVGHLYAPHQALFLQAGAKAPQLQEEAGQRAHCENVEGVRRAHLVAPVGSAGECYAT